jgi:DNA-binding response OmpR family regulator
MSDPKAASSVSALVVGDYENDRMLLHDVFRKAGWRLFEARDRRTALRCLDERPVHVVLTKKAVRDWSWKSLLADLRRLVRPPQLIVTSHLSDEMLWAEALNWGAYDVLAEPLHREEVERVIASARRHFDLPLRAGQAIVTPVAGVA